MPVTFNYHFTIQQLQGENYFFGLASLFLYCTINQFFIHYVHHFLFLLGLVCENFFWFGWVIISSSSSVFLSLCASYLALSSYPSHPTTVQWLCFLGKQDGDGFLDALPCLSLSRCNLGVNSTFYHYYFKKRVEQSIALLLFLL